MIATQLHRQGRRALLAAGFAVTLGLATGAAQAGRSCEQHRPSAESIVKAMTLAEHTAGQLDRAGANVVVIARAGQDLSEYGLRYSHLGFAYREAAGEPWRIVHKLNRCGSAEASLYRQGLGEFFLDDLWQYEAAIVVLAPQAQARLIGLLADNERVARLDTPAYSMVAYPWSERYQQSNQWALETLAMAEDAAAKDRARAQAWLRLRGYEPTTLRLSAFRRLGARMFAANVAFDDHPNEKRFSDRIETVTVDSVFRWLDRSGLGGKVEVIR
ncbi:MAG: DUF2145 domain-containing protein [Caldimonas sp.]